MTKFLLIAMALVEVGTGAGLVIAPSFIVWLLLGEGLASPQSLVLGRITGVALLSIGVACSRATSVEPSAHRRLIGSMLIYNLAVPAFLTQAAIDDGMRGIATWPACVLHFGVALWSIRCLSAPSFEN